MFHAKIKKVRRIFRLQFLKIYKEFRNEMFSLFYVCLQPNNRRLVIITLERQKKKRERKKELIKIPNLPFKPKQ